MSSYATCTGYTWPCDKCGEICRSASGLCEKCQTKTKRCIECRAEFVTKRDDHYCLDCRDQLRREVAGDEYIYF
jgi:hypothetical protein